MTTRTSRCTQLGLGLGLLGSLGACASFAAPTAATLAKVAPMPLAAALPGRFELEIASPGLTGAFDGVCGVDAAGFRVQLFPEVGGKVLDVTVGRDRIVADLPGSHYEALAPFGSAEPHLALVVAMLFAELLAPVQAERVLGERAGAAGEVEVRQRPALAGVDVQALLGADGAVRRYRCVLGWLDLTLDADGTFTGRSVRGSVRVLGGG